MEKIKKCSLTAICLLIAFSSIAEDVFVKGYYKKNGTYRMSPFSNASALGAVASSGSVISAVDSFFLIVSQ